MQLQAMLTTEDDWRLPLSHRETVALIENIAGTVLVLESFEIVSILIGPRFIIRVEDVLIERFDEPDGAIWAALNPSARWASCPCASWRERRSCRHVDALQRRAVPPSEQLARVLPFHTSRRPG